MGMMVFSIGYFSCRCKEGTLTGMVEGICVSSDGVYGFVFED